MYFLFMDNMKIKKVVYFIKGELIAFNQKSLTINSELKQNPYVKEYYLNKWVFKRFIISYLTASVKIK
ncbi:hypothetical protein C5467_18400 [Photorhabdus khanii subsp. guanajuatensis]|uniref:Uncharacterized protein n=1 Tax=Photorhabdus khanii subsp. guanajuatensis TaxID=2100166 RepID=A0A4R4J5K9_9GAMM|nr:hypothetical protein C5467_18400 [Photorhabdus khanii subsp. guanajuatensis]